MNIYFLKLNITNLYLLIIIILFFFCLFLLQYTKILKRKFNEISNELDKEKSNKKVEIKNEEAISLDKLDKEIDIIEPDKKDNKIINKTENIIKDKEDYKKNIIEKKNKITSPININSDEEFNLKDYIKKEKIDNINRPNKESENYLKEVSKKLKSEAKKECIELTDYEKEQEMTAIISYKELLKEKDKLYPIKDDEDDINFINGLKDLRNDLNN